MVRNEENRRAFKALIARFPLLKKISRQILNKYRQGGMPAIEGFASAPSAALVKEILASDYFDVVYYQKSAGRVFSSGRDALYHYLSDGEKRYLRPSAQFDPLVYRYGHTDLSGLKSSALLHYFRHGRAENRLTVLDFDAISWVGGRHFMPDRPTVMLACHEASMTGAPILGYNIAEQLAETCNVVSFILGDGILVDNFRQTSTLMLVAPRGTSGLNSRILQERILTLVKDSCGLDYVIANSIETANVAGAAQGLDVPVIALVHEFAEYVSPQERVFNVVAQSQLVVFSSILTAESALKCRALDSFRNYLVLPQGKSNIPVSSAMPMSVQLDRLLEDQKSEQRFLVIGCGFVQIRKGVDLFVSVAHRLAKLLGPEKLQFLWVGDGYNPKKDLVYSVWIRDQIVRSGLSNVVTILPGVAGADLERLYTEADAMMMSSRLDPFPNVTIDAMQAGLPVVCFEGASGTAEFLGSMPQFKPLVAPYLDVDAAAQILARLATEQDFHREMGEALEAISIEAFDMRRYVNKLMNILKQARGMSEQERMDFGTLSETDALSDAALGNALGPTSSPHEKIRKYLRFAASGVQGVDRIYRRPIMGFSPHIYQEQHQELEKAPFPNHFSHWIRAGRPAGRWYRDIIRFGTSPVRQDATNKLKVALHVHLHYPDILDEILTRIQRNITRPDLLVTVTSDEGLDYVTRKLRGYSDGKTDVRRVPNLGRDFGPMITEFGSMLHEYDVVGHIHGKKSVEISGSGSPAPLGDVWREFLFENLVGGKTAAIDEIVTVFCQRRDVGLIFPEDPNVVGWTANYQPAKELIARLGVNADLPSAIEFPVGNMFYARPQALAPIFNSGLKWGDYPAEPLGYDGTVLHAMERITPVICEDQGYTWVTTEVPGFYR